MKHDITSFAKLLLAILLPVFAGTACGTGTTSGGTDEDESASADEVASDDAESESSGDGSQTAGDEPGNPPPADFGTAPMVALDFDGTDEDFLNPERGFYVGLDLLDGDDDDAARVRAGGHTLAIAIVRLDAYRDHALDAELLDALRDGLARVRRGGIKVILRFTYNASQETGDASRDRILQHIEQLAPVMHANADVISVVQAGFIGAWGEWHSSTHGLDNDEDRGAIVRALLDAVPASRAVQIRTPMYKEAIFPGGPLDENDAWSGADRARLGHHNDCFLASSSDYGTFASPVESWQDYVAQDGQYLPVGGETCAVYAPRTNCDAALETVEHQHWSFLNEEYNQDVLDGWVDQGCDDDISLRLGHRLALVGARTSESVAPGGALDVELEIENQGFSAPYNARPIVLVLSRSNKRWEVTLDGRDARQLAPGLTTIAVRLRVPAGAQPGDDYELSLWMPDASDRLRDDPRQAIRLANDGTWNAATGTNTVTRSLRVDAAAPGEVDASATKMVEL
ncbi:MAG TPA: DUF4832 domain-containing protein [Kofleriaceae bacterium]|nr:DUF4832 domain-containing protein [Kofleriaceae bacterium]